MIEFEVKQLAPIEPGWKFWHVVDGWNTEGIELASCPITAQAVVLGKGYRDEHGGNTETEVTVDFIVFDDQHLQPLSDVQREHRNCINSYPVGVSAPNETFTMEDERVTDAIACLKKKIATHEAPTAKTVVLAKKEAA